MVDARRLEARFAQLSAELTAVLREFERETDLVVTDLVVDRMDGGNPPGRRQIVDRVRAQAALPFSGGSVVVVPADLIR